MAAIHCRVDQVQCIQEHHTLKLFGDALRAHEYQPDVETHQGPWLRTKGMVIISGMIVCAESKLCIGVKWVIRSQALHGPGSRCALSLPLHHQPLLLLHVFTSTRGQLPGEGSETRREWGTCKGALRYSPTPGKPVNTDEGSSSESQEPCCANYYHATCYWRVATFLVWMPGRPTRLRVGRPGSLSG